jgi:hypothetical protein
MIAEFFESLADVSFSDLWQVLTEQPSAPVVGRR